MPLNNDGDEVVLIDAGGVARSRVAYGEGQARSGAWVEFGTSASKYGSVSETQATVTTRRANEHLFRCGTTSEFLQTATCGVRRPVLASRGHPTPQLRHVSVLAVAQPRLGAVRWTGSGDACRGHTVRRKHVRLALAPPAPHGNL